MTLRLVALISLVLLLSLAAFGLLMAYYQEQVVQVVAETASHVGRATLRTLDLGEHQVRVGGQTRNVFGWSSGQIVSEGLVEAVPEGGEAGATELRRIVVTHVGDPDEVRRRIRHVEQIVTESDGELIAVRERISGNFAEEQCVPVIDLETGCPGSTQDGSDVSAAFFIDIEDVHVDFDRSGGPVLKIPTLTPADEQQVHQEHSFAFETSGNESAGQNVFLAKDEIRLPIELEQYRELSDKVRSRSLALFLGVFAVGMVLSTGLAARFTRPIRKLDAGFRRLSAGDLDVRVDVRGKDEIGRLSRAFNEMAGKLRANRDRSRDIVRREKLTALGRLAAGVAHDVRNPLHSIGLTLQHLQETTRPGNGPQAEEFDRSLEIIRGEIRRLDQLVGNFLSFAKSERRERERVDLGELLRETARLVQKEAERRNVELCLEIDVTTPPVPADVEALRSAILNLVLNAFEAMPDGGRLRLELTGDGEQALLDVSDTGEGIPEEHRDHVFDFAYTTREGGNGLGLAMVHHCIVEEHAGQISLESTPLEGTRVRVALPLTPAGSGGQPS